MELKIVGTRSAKRLIAAIIISSREGLNISIPMQDSQLLLQAREIDLDLLASQIEELLLASKDLTRSGKDLIRSFL